MNLKGPIPCALCLQLGLAGISMNPAPTPAATSNTLPIVSRPPAVPIITHTPYFSIWSATDRLTDDVTRHWTGKPQPLVGLIRVDGRAYRVMGSEPGNVPAFPQTALTLTSTSSVYEFANAQVRLKLTFVSPLLPAELEVLARPVSYIVWEVQSNDRQFHEVSICTLVGGEVAVNTIDQPVAWRREKIGGLAAMRIGSEGQPVLESRGDDRRIDWGYCYLATPGRSAAGAAGARGDLARAFASDGRLPASVDKRMPRAVSDAQPAIAVCESFGRVKAPATRFQMLAYDEVFSIQYFGRNLRPYWRRDGANAADLLKAAAADFARVRKRCAAFDRELAADAVKVGGPDYAYLCALAHRQALAACGLAADAKGAPLLFPKENHSNGCIATVDVIYPQIPQLLLLSPTLAKAILVPVLDYSASSYWPYPYAPHDIGTYPMSNGQVYGMGGSDSDRMPVEESGNMLIMLAALAEAEGNADFAARYWPTLLKWADYLAEHGFDPENQLCTDDFAGHLARNANLAIKAVLGVASMSRLCKLRGDSAGAVKYAKLAREGAAQWQRLAADGDHTVLAFGMPGTWSQKYNLVWDSILGLRVFPPALAKSEAAFYLTKLNTYGLPLDSRESRKTPGMTKADWTVWSSTLGGSRDDVERFAAPLCRFFDETPERSPMTDWYSTVSGHKIGFTARSVVGGVYLPFLTKKPTWRKWAARDGGNPSGHIWAKVPRLPQRAITSVIATAMDKPAMWRFTTTNPGEGWTAPKFDDSKWKEGLSGFGTPGTPGARVSTEWKTDDIWLRRTIRIPSGAAEPLWFLVHHDEDVEIHVNGIQAARAPGWITGYEPLEVKEPEAKRLLKPGARITLAVHCHQTEGGQYIDVGIVTARRK
jgi:hypothetical protein